MPFCWEQYFSTSRQSIYLFISYIRVKKFPIIKENYIKVLFCVKCLLIRKLLIEMSVKSMESQEVNPSIVWLEGLTAKQTGIERSLRRIPVQTIAANSVWYELSLAIKSKTNHFIMLCMHSLHAFKCVASRAPQLL